MRLAELEKWKIFTVLNEWNHEKKTKKKSIVQQNENECERRVKELCNNGKRYWWNN